MRAELTVLMLKWHGEHTTKPEGKNTLEWLFKKQKEEGKKKPQCFVRMNILTSYFFRKQKNDMVRKHLHLNTVHINIQWKYSSVGNIRNVFLQWRYLKIFYYICTHVTCMWVWQSTYSGVHRSEDSWKVLLFVHDIGPEIELWSSKHHLTDPEDTWKTWTYLNFYCKLPENPKSLITRK